MIWSVPVPGFGAVFVEANSPGDSVAAVRRYLNRNRIRLEEGAVIGTATLSSLAQAQGRLTLDSSGDPIAVQSTASATASTPAPQPTSHADPHDFSGTATDTGNTTSSVPVIPGSSAMRTSPAFVGKVVGSDGAPRYYRVDASDTDIARRILEERFGASARVELVSGAEFLVEHDADFRVAFQESGASSLDAFVNNLAHVTSPVSSPVSPDAEPIYASPAAMDTLPVDVQDFPYASFQNAVAALGLDPEGALGSTISQRFDTLAPVAQIGSITGTINPIGQDPGALQRFFGERFGDLEIAAQTFRDLLAGRTGTGVDAEGLLALRSLQNPDIATATGRSAAADVFRLARAAAEDRFGSFVASRILPSNQRLFRELERELAQGSTGTGFLEFARSQNLLPA